MPAPFFPSINAPMAAPPAAGRPMVSASFFFVAGATATHERVRIV